MIVQTTANISEGLHIRGCLRNTREAGSRRGGRSDDRGLGSGELTGRGYRVPSHVEVIHNADPILHELSR